MATKLRVAVVGDGIIGWSSAFELARRGADVTLFRGSWSGGATSASAGILAPYIEAHHGSALRELATRGLSIFDDFVAKLRAASHVAFEYRKAGTLEVAVDPDRASLLRQRLSSTSAAAARLRWLDEIALRTEAPYLAPDSVGALACDAHGYVSVRSFVMALEDAARRSGATALQGPVRSVDVRSKRVSVFTDEDRVFDTIVLAAGAWTPMIDPFGRTNGVVRPIRGQLVRLKSPRLREAPILWGSDCYIVPWQEGTVLVGATEEDADFEVRATAEGVRGLLDAAARLVPALSSATFVDVRVGLRPASVEGVPVLGPGEDPRIVYATGHFRNGVLLAPLTAELIASYVLEGQTDPAFTETEKRGHST